MLYAILCYDSEDAVAAWPKDKEAAFMRRSDEIEDSLAARGRLGPVARLMPTSAAMTVRKGAGPVILDGPFAETKEQLLGFYLVNCDSLEEVLEITRELAESYPGQGTYEVRPMLTIRCEEGARWTQAG
jgi:hypothetical protein